MRPFEILLVVANFCTFVVFAVPRLRAIRWAGYVVLITLALVVVQILVEGSRWQMVPAYVLAGLFLVVWVVQQVAASSRSSTCEWSRVVRLSCVSLAWGSLPLSLLCSQSFTFLLPADPIRSERSPIIGWIAVATNCSALIRVPIVS